MRMTGILECQKLNICVQFRVPNKRNLLQRPMWFFSAKNVTRVLRMCADSIFITIVTVFDY